MCQSHLRRIPKRRPADEFSEFFGQNRPGYCKGDGRLSSIFRRRSGTICAGIIDADGLKILSDPNSSEPVRSLP